MVIQTWIMAGLVASGLVAILFIVSGAVNYENVIFAVIAFAFAAILLTIKRVVIRPRTA